MAEDLKMPRRIVNEELGVPVPVKDLLEKRKDIDEEKLLHLLTEDYRANPGLYMSPDDVKEFFEVEDDRLDQLLLSL